MSHDNKILDDFSNQLQGAGAPIILDNTSIFDRSLDQHRREFRDAFFDNFYPGQGLGVMLDRNGPFQGGFDADMDRLLDSYRAAQVEEPDPNYNPRGDLRFAKLPDHMWDFADEARSFGEGTIILNMLKGTLDKKRQIEESGPFGSLGVFAGITAGELPAFFGGLSTVAVTLPLVTGLNEGIAQYTDPTRSAEQSAVNIGVSAGLGLGFFGLHKILSPRLPPDQAANFAKSMDEELRAQEPPRPRDDILSDDGIASAITPLPDKESLLSPPAHSLYSAGANANNVANALKEFPEVFDVVDDLRRIADDLIDVTVVNEAGVITTNSIKEIVAGVNTADAISVLKPIIETFETALKKLDSIPDPPLKFIQAREKLTDALEDALYYRNSLLTKTPRQIIDTSVAVNSKAEMAAVVRAYQLEGEIGPVQTESILSVIDVMPDNFFVQAAFGANRSKSSSSQRGFYSYFEDVIGILGLPLKKTPGQGARTFSHEVGHRVFFTMARESELKVARAIFDDFRTKKSTSESLKGYPNERDHFSEWWAFEWADYWMRRMEFGETAALNFMETAYSKNALGLANIFERMMAQVFILTGKLAGRPGFGTQEQMMDQFFNSMISRIGKRDRAKIEDDINEFSFSRATRFKDGDDFLSGARGKPGQGGLTFGSIFDESLEPNLAAYEKVGDDLPYDRQYVPQDDANKLLPAWFLEKLPDSPVKRMLQGDSPFARHIASYLVEHPFYQQKNARPGSNTGVTPHGVDRNVAVEWLAPMVEALKGTDDLYAAYRQRFYNEFQGAEKIATPHKSGVVQFADDTLRGSGGALTRNEFMEQVTRAKIRTERTAGQTAEEAGLVPEAIQAAKLWSEKLFSRAGTDAQKLEVFSITQRRRVIALEKKMQKLLDDTNNSRGMTVKQVRFLDSLEKQINILKAEITEANTFPLDPNYINRIYNKSKIIENRDEFISILMREGGYTKVEAAARTDTILSGKAFQAIEEDATGMARSLKERQIEVDSIYLEDFLELNIASLGRYYATRMGADIELTRQFGSIDMKEVVARLANEYDEMIKVADPSGYVSYLDNLAAEAELGLEATASSVLNKKALAIAKKKDQAIEDVRAIRDRIRGTYGIPEDPTTWTNRGIRLAKMFNATTLLTGALAAGPDLGKLIMADGLKRTIGPILEAYKSDLGLWRTMKLAKREANIAGEAVDMYLAMRSALFADLADSLSAATPFERNMGNATQQFFNISLMNQWNEGVKTMASLITGSRIIAESENLIKGTISKTEATKLANVGISKETAEIIVEQVRKHGMTGESGHVRIAKTELWDAEAREAAAIYTRALGKDINRIIVTPGKGETPLFMSTPIWTLLFQFKTFAIAATHRTLTPGLQLRDQNFLLGNIALVGLGGMVNEIRREQLDIKGEQKFGDWLISAIERGGSVGAISDLNGALETLSDNRIGLRPLLGAPRNFGASGLSKASTIGGPIVQQAGNAARVIWDLGPGEADQRTADATRRLLYGGKMFWADGLYDAVQDGASALYGE